MSRVGGIPVEFLIAGVFLVWMGFSTMAERVRYVVREPFDVRRDRRGQMRDEVWNDFDYQLDVNGQARRVSERMEWEIDRRGRGKTGILFVFASFLFFWSFGIVIFLDRGLIICGCSYFLADCC